MKWSVDRIAVQKLPYAADIVVPDGVPDLYSLSILALPDAALDWSRAERDQHSMAMRICNFLNGGPRPEWLNDFEVCDSNRALSLAGASITALIRLPDDSYRVSDDKNDVPLAHAMRRALDLLIHLLEEKVA